MRKHFNTKENTDSGMAFILILLLIGLIFKLAFSYKLAVVFILVLMIKPGIFYPFTFVWLNLSDFLGKVISKVLLTLIFLIFVLPVGLFRKLNGKDSLKLKIFRKSGHTVFIERNHKFTKDDLINPY